MSQHKITFDDLSMAEGTALLFAHAEGKLGKSLSVAVQGQRMRYIIKWQTGGYADFHLTDDVHEAVETYNAH